MNAITPLARAVLDALDHDEDGFCHGDVACLVGCKLPSVEADEFDAALDALCADSMVDLVAVQSPSGALVGRIYKLTEAGCDALWALQKAERVDAGFAKMRGEVKAAFADAFARPVHFGSREAMQAYLSGAVA